MSRVFENPSELVFGRETADQARERFEAAIHRIVSEHAGQDISIVSHGTVISLFAATVLDIDPYCLWSRLELPSYLTFTLPTFRLEEVVEAVC